MTNQISKVTINETDRQGESKDEKPTQTEHNFDRAYKRHERSNERECMCKIKLHGQDQG